MALTTTSRSSKKRSSELPENNENLLLWADNVPIDGPPPKRWLHKFVRILLICLRETKGNVLSLRAGYLTYAMLLSMVPMLAMSTAVMKGLGGGDQLWEVVYSYVDSLQKSPPIDTEQPPASTNTKALEGETTEKAADLTTHLRSAVDKIFD